MRMKYTEKQLREFARRYARFTTQSANECYIAIAEIYDSTGDISGIITRIESLELAYKPVYDFGYTDSQDRIISGCGY